MADTGFWHWLSPHGNTNQLQRLLDKMDGPIYDVFLGGSCGRTTWRRDFVLPHFRELGISYYNPQSTHWHEDMIREEEEAKRNSRFLLFGIHPHTTNAASFVEIAYLIASNAPIVVVLLSKNTWIKNANPEDRTDRGRLINFIEVIIAKHQVPCFESFAPALRYIDERLIGEKFLVEIIRNPTCRWTYLNIKLLNCTSSCTRAVSSLSVGSVLSSAWLWAQQVEHLLIPRTAAEFVQMAMLSLELLLLVLLALTCPNVPVILLVLSILLAHVIACVIIPRKWFSFKRRRRFSPAPLHNRQRRHRSRPIRYDVYIGGSGQYNDWIPDLAVPILNRQGVSYLDSTLCPEWSHRLRLLPGCTQIMHYVSSPYSFLSGLVELSYCLGRRDLSLIACVPLENSMLPVHCCTDERTQVRRRTRNSCYNRALCYVKDLAQQHNVTIMEDLQKAIRAAIDKAKIKR